MGGWLLLPLALVLDALVAWGPGSASGFAYSAGVLTIALGLVTKGRRLEHWRGVTRVGLAVVLVTALVRVSGVGAKEPAVGLVTLPGVRPGRWIDRLVDERDPVLAGARLYGLQSKEARGLADALDGLYSGMKRDRGAAPSPVAGTFLLGQSPEAFDTLVIPARKPAKTAVIFLHGYAGSFTIQCWQMAQAASAIGALTVCPSVDWRGQWWTEGGARTVQDTLQFLEGRGITRVYLSGLSNGARGASELAGRFASRLAGVVLVSGGSQRARLAELPTLVIQGTRDGMMSVGLARQMTATNRRAQLRTFDGNHFLYAERASEVRDAIAQWLEKQEERD